MIFYALTRANKAAFAEEYDTAKQKFDVGLVPITDVYDSAGQIRPNQGCRKSPTLINWKISLESLHEITNHYYQFLDGLGEQGISLITPGPQ